MHVTEVEMAATVGGPDLCVGGTAFGSQAGGTRPPENAFDNAVTGTSFFQEDDSSTWGVMSGSHVGYDFGTPVTIGEVRRKSVNAAGQFVREARVQVLRGSDDLTNWFYYDILRFGVWTQNETKTAAVNSGTLLPTNEYPFWGINCTKTVLGQIQLAELIFANSAGGASIVTGLPPIFGMRGAGTGEGFEARRFLDGNGTASKFVHNTYTPNAWKSGLLGVCFTAPQNPAELRLQAVADFPTGGPEDFTIVRSHNGVNWEVMRTVTGQTGWTAGQVRAFSIP
jgi:hypothetical protein